MMDKNQMVGAWFYVDYKECLNNIIEHQKQSLNYKISWH